MKFLRKKHFHYITAFVLILICLKLYFSNQNLLLNLQDNVIIQSNTKFLGTFNFVQPAKDKILSNTCEIVIAVILCEELASTNQQESLLLSKHISSKRITIANDFSRQVSQLIVLLKSIVISMKYSPRPQQQLETNNDNDDCVKVIIISTREHYDSVLEIIYENEKERWSNDFLNYLKFAHYEVSYPEGTTWMKTMFRPCATLRLFLPNILIKYKRLIYLDTDIIFLRNIKDLWTEFDKFRVNETIASMSACLFHYGTKANKVPFYGKTGLNAGIMLMDLNTMRNSLWTHKLKMITEMYQNNIKLADQDILNIYFHFFPEQLHEFSCEWNFRPWNCRKGSYCYDVNTQKSLSALHGNALSFTKVGSEIWFYTIFQHFGGINMNSEFSKTNHILGLTKSLRNLNKPSQCSQYPELTEILLNNLVKRLV